MEQFSLGEYLKNPDRKVVTRDGRNVRIICTDADCEEGPIVVLIKNKNGKDVPFTYFESGKYYDQIMQMPECDLDLFFAPNKHTDYINLYHSNLGYYLGGKEYSTKQEAERVAAGAGDAYIATIKAEWEE